MKSHLLVPLLAIILCSCAHKKKVLLPNEITTHLKADLTKINSEFLLSEVVESINYVPLKVPSNEVIGKIGKVMFHNNEFYIFDIQRQTIHVYDLEGIFERKIIAQGPGPQEYARIDFVDIDKTSNELVIFNISRGTILSYDLEGKFVKSQRCKIISRDFVVTEDGGYLFYCPDEKNHANGRDLNPGVYYMSKNSDDFEKVVSIGGLNYSPIITPSSFVKNERSIELYSTYSDSIYTITNNKVSNRQLIEYSTPTDFNILTDPDWLRNLDKHESALLKMFPVRTSNVRSFLFSHKGKVKHFIQKGKGIYLAENLINDIDAGHYVLGGSFPMKDNTVLSYISQENIESVNYTSRESQKYVNKNNLKLNDLDVQKRDAAIGHLLNSEGNNEHMSPVLVISRLSATN